ncbi:RICIN domain-containing protein [Streptomyces sp. NBC_01214]|uniref:RICIN domain-containing protein n=1 Tax=Streptomyces sp. NBC_01214 TaxID=2903777 RepID=UPI00225AA756|nr:RICIN domain-containing protein [Streptomyces sp. NBC_01214]MCX4808134.1 RICIN domain-containing protein [Streptomyces sp. NBC_01214]
MAALSAAHAAVLPAELPAGLAVSSASTASAASTEYDVVNRGSGKCLAVDWAAEYHVLSIQWAKGSSVWGTFYEIKNGDGPCLGTLAGGTSNGTDIVARECNGANDQRWFVDPVVNPPEYRTIRSLAARFAGSNKCLGIYKEATQDAALTATLWDCNSRWDQQQQVQP